MKISIPAAPTLPAAAAAFLAATAAFLAATAGFARAQTAVQRGKYLVTIMDCGGCHTTGALVGHPDPAGYMAGADIGWDMPSFGIVYPRNITPDKETGIGAWSSADIVKLLRTGQRPDGREVAPIMNWRSYAQMTDADVHAVAAYLKSIPAVKHETLGPTAKPEVKTPYFTVAAPH